MIEVRNETWAIGVLADLLAKVPAWQAAVSGKPDEPATEAAARARIRRFGFLPARDAKGDPIKPVRPSALVTWPSRSPFTSADGRAFQGVVGCRLIIEIDGDLDVDVEEDAARFTAFFDSIRDGMLEVIDRRKGLLPVVCSRFERTEVPFDAKRTETDDYFWQAAFEIDLDVVR